MKSEIALAIHGGAGTILKANITSEKEKEYREALNESLCEAYEILKNGGSGLEAVERAVMTMEDSDLFNAGKGSVFTAEGKHEMEASIMCGKTLEAGAVANVRNIKNPVLLSKKVLENEDFVFLSGKGANEFADEHQIEVKPDDYFYSEHRYNQWQNVKKSEGMVLDHDGDRKFGTVGAVALDSEGNIAAATSTGGLTNKKYGRLGDSAVVGSGVYANNKTCAVSCTGYGEFFLRGVVAYDISCLMEYKKLTLEEAAHEVINKKMTEMKGEGGAIAIDAKGNIALPFNSEGMYRGYIKSDGKPIVHIYK